MSRHDGRARSPKQNAGLPDRAGIERLLIDGNNLLHREGPSVDAGAVRGLLARLQLSLPRGVQTTVMLDGHAAPGSPPAARISRSLELRHAGSHSADDAILAAVAGLSLAARGATIVVTDDRALAERVRAAGARTRRLDWLHALLGRGAGGSARPAPGLGAGGRAVPQATGAAGDDERPGWRPGRGATRKKGNPRRGRRRPA